MSEKSTVGKAIAASEMVRKARELAWVLSAVFVVIPIVAITEIFFLRSPTKADAFDGNDVEAAIAAFVSLALLLRMVPIAIRLGRDLNDPAFLVKQNTGSIAFLYLVKRFFGADTNAA